MLLILKKDENERKDPPQYQPNLINKSTVASPVPVLFPSSRIKHVFDYNSTANISTKIKKPTAKKQLIARFSMRMPASHPKTIIRYLKQPRHRRDG